ncbi:hypothetical protein DAEQUDRAFT_123066 [Daedalea quercina L-15889]|uniref:Uncharacterized protein n=1 Tax=Daedalea quercina L-15889 TaxID=1314783 RepID=A0A165RXI6_9APHY|nr:hypothetical protein DAEQUDRAFT_123066 [Daedalea quercina L-15889]
MPDIPSFNPSRSEPMPMPFQSSISPRSRDQRLPVKERPSPSRSSRSGSSCGSSELIFPMDPELTTTEGRPHHWSYVGGHPPTYSPTTYMLPPPLPTLRVRCGRCSQDFVPRSDHAARMKLCDECGAGSSRRPTIYTPQPERGRLAMQQTERRRYRSLAQSAAPPTATSNTRQHRTQDGFPSTGPALVAQPGCSPDLWGGPSLLRD